MFSNSLSRGNAFLYGEFSSSDFRGASGSVAVFLKVDNPDYSL